MSLHLIGPLLISVDATQSVLLICNDSCSHFLIGLWVPIFPLVSSSAHSAKQKGLQKKVKLSPTPTVQSFHVALQQSWKLQQGMRPSMTPYHGLSSQILVLVAHISCGMNWFSWVTQILISFYKNFILPPLPWLVIGFSIFVTLLVDAFFSLYSYPSLFPHVSTSPWGRDHTFSQYWAEACLTVVFRCWMNEWIFWTQEQATISFFWNTASNDSYIANWHLYILYILYKICY